MTLRSLQTSPKSRTGSFEAQSPSSSHSTVRYLAVATESANSAAIERLHLLKKDASQIGQNARRTVKFLDKMSSGKNDLPHEPIIIQGPDEQYATWQEVEAHYKENATEKADVKAVKETESKQATDTATKRTSGTALSQMLLDKLNFAPQPASPGSTPPLSPTSSGPQSSKNSPEVRNAIMATDKSPVPPVLKPLLNPVAWYVHEKSNDGTEIFFLTNSADIQHLARDFDIPTKTIHQMRSTIGMEAIAPPSPKATAKKQEPEKKTLFSYDDESEEEEVVFKPRGRGGPVRGLPARGNVRMRSRTSSMHRSPRPAFSTVTTTANNAAPDTSAPKIPIDEIDPDSFDRGSFGRGTGQLANVGNHYVPQTNGHFPRGSPVAPRNPRGGYRGRAMNRGAALNSPRGRGRLFVP